MKISLIVVLLLVGCSSRQALTTPPQEAVLFSSAVTLNRNYLAVGDSITAGTGSSIQQNCFASLLGVYLNTKYPFTTLLNWGEPGFTAERYVESASFIKTYINNINPDFMTIELGMNDLVHSQEEVYPGVFNMPYSQAVSFSYVFKTALKTGVIDILKGPHTRMAIANIYYIDRFAQWPDGVKIWKMYNQRILEVAREERIPLVDLATVFNGHTAAWVADVHPNDLGHQAIAQAFKKVF